MSGFRSLGEPPWVDPREHPDPPLRLPPRPPSPDATGLIDLVRLCREGRVYEVEKWIRDGTPIQALDYRHGARSHRLDSPLRVAIETKQFDLARLLLCNGFLPDLEQESPLELVLRSKAKGYLELLLSWGADPKRVRPVTILDTYDVSLMESFWESGVDLTKEHVLAQTLALETSNKPAYGWAKRHRDDPRIARELAIALGDAVMEGREKAVQLLLRAGADPHRKVPSLRFTSPADEDEPENQVSAVEWAVTGGKGGLLRRLKPNPDLDDFEDLWKTVCETETLNLLTSIRLPADWSEMLFWNVSRFVNGYSSSLQTRRVIEVAVERFQARITTIDSGRWSSLRRDLLRAKDEGNLRWVLKWLKKPEHCDAVLFTDLTSTPAMKRKLVELKVVPRPGHASRTSGRD